MLCSAVGEKYMSCPRGNLSNFVMTLQGWFDEPAMPGIIKGPPAKATTAMAGKLVDELAPKEETWVARRDQTVQESLVGQCLEKVRGWM